MYSFRVYGSCVVNPIIHGLIPRPSRYEIWQYRCEELATQLISHHASVFLGVILLSVNKPRPWKWPWAGSKKETKMKYSSERTSESWRKVEATTGDQACKRSIESRVEKGVVMIAPVPSGWLASSYPIRRAFLQHIS